MASGDVNRTYRPNAWPHRPSLHARRKPLATRSRPRMAQTWHKADLAQSRPGTKRTLRWGLETSGTECVMTPLMAQAHDAQTLH
ncbi:MAG: hypothetical protein JWQ17_2062 [Tardiphaga sp.]|nr:hypothetical protein [Tardiphaga sp.]